MSVHYAAAQSGGWLGVIRDGLAVVFDVDTQPAVVDSAWSAMAGDNALQTLLDTLTRDGLSATPPFAVVEWSAETRTVRAIVRGGVELVVADLAGDQHTLSGKDAATWIERHFSSAVSATVTVEGASVLAGTPPLPVASAVVVAASVSIVLTDSAQQGAPVVARAPSEQVETTASAVPTEQASVEQAHVEQAPVRRVPVESVPNESTLASTPGSESEFDSGDVSDDTVVRPPRIPRQAPDAAAPDSAAPDAAAPDSPAAVPTAAAVDRRPEPEPEVLEGDHDGETIMTSDIAALRGRRRQSAETPSPVSPPPAISVRLPDGSREPLVQPVLVGRAPSVSKVSGGSLPRLVSLGAEDQDISRNHAQVALEGDTIVVTDLHSRNGTVIVLPGKSPQKLRAGEPTPVIVGTVIDLGGGISLTVDED